MDITIKFTHEFLKLSPEQSKAYDKWNQMIFWDVINEDIESGEKKYKFNEDGRRFMKESGAEDFINNHYDVLKNFCVLQDLFSFDPFGFSCDVNYILSRISSHTEINLETERPDSLKSLVIDEEALNNIFNFCEQEFIDKTVGLINVCMYAEELYNQREHPSKEDK